MLVLTGGRQTLDFAVGSDRFKVPPFHVFSHPKPRSNRRAKERHIQEPPHPTPTPRAIYNSAEVVSLTSHFLADPLPWQ